MTDEHPDFISWVLNQSPKMSDPTEQRDAIAEYARQCEREIVVALDRLEAAEAEVARLRNFITTVLDDASKVVNYHQAPKGGMTVGYIPRMHYSQALAFERDARNIAGLVYDYEARELRGRCDD